jgi:hypothetical protein
VVPAEGGIIPREAVDPEAIWRAMVKRDPQAAIIGTVAGAANVDPGAVDVSTERLRQFLAVHSMCSANLGERHRLRNRLRSRLAMVVQ